ncbi:unnamed protein product, partial [Brassica rapa]
VSSKPPPLTAQVCRSRRAFRPLATVSDHRSPEPSCPATVCPPLRSCHRIAASPPPSAISR